ncbi:MAG: S-methyl-5'-thioadenosine phosphorylase [Halobacteriota archaeon]
MSEADIAIIGGTGVYDQDAFENVKQVDVDTPFGKPADSILVGDFEGRRVAFLPRHGKKHRYSPTMVPYRANIFALKKLGVTRVISVAAAGSLKEEIHPLDIVIPSQLFDHTKLRKNTFFEDIVVHVGMAEPFCPQMLSVTEEVTKKLGYNYHFGRTYICMEGPQFSTRAESYVYRQLGFDIIGMTASPEAKLSREAEMCYATIATITDYDVWKEEHVDVATVVDNAAKNEEKVRNILRSLIPAIPEERDCGCGNSLQYALITHPSEISTDLKEKLGLLIGKYI